MILERKRNYYKHIFIEYFMKKIIDKIRKKFSKKRVEPKVYDPIKIIKNNIWGILHYGAKISVFHYILERISQIKDKSMFPLKIRKKIDLFTPFSRLKHDEKMALKLKDDVYYYLDKNNEKIYGLDDFRLKVRFEKDKEKFTLKDLKEIYDILDKTIRVK